jgi:hypothetical protein
MSRIPTHTLEDAPAASRPLLQKIIQSTPTGRPANLHAQMAHSPARRVCLLGGDGIHRILPQLRANRYGCLVVDRAELMPLPPNLGR